MESNAKLEARQKLARLIEDFSTPANSILFPDNVFTIHEFVMVSPTLRNTPNLQDKVIKDKGIFNEDSIANQQDESQQFNEDSREDIKETLVGLKAQYEDAERQIAEKLNAIIEEAKYLLSEFESKDITDLQLKQRLLNLKVMVDMYNLLSIDGWSPLYISQFLRIQLALRESDIFSICPSKLIEGDSFSKSGKGVFEAKDKIDDSSKIGHYSPSDGSTVCMAIPSVQPTYACFELVTPTGILFGNMRGEGGVCSKFYDWLRENKGDPGYIGGWAEAQKGTSWSGPSKYAKLFYTSFRNKDFSRYFWHPKSNFKYCFEGVSSKFYIGEREIRFIDFDSTYQFTLIAQHVFTYEFLCRTQLPRSDQQKKQVTIMRLENRNDLKEICGYIPQIGEAIANFQQGPAESFSLVSSYKDPSKEGVEADTLGPFYVTTIDVPFHRVFATYVQCKPQDMKDCLFLNEGENELLCMTEGCPIIFRGADKSYYRL